MAFSESVLSGHKQLEQLGLIKCALPKLTLASLPRLSLVCQSDGGKAQPDECQLIVRGAFWAGVNCADLM